jgi:hypothetical protein
MLKTKRHEEKVNSSWTHYTEKSQNHNMPQIAPATIWKPEQRDSYCRDFRTRNLLIGKT